MSDPVRIWRPADADGVLLMAGTAEQYAIEPRGEWVFGLVEHASMRARREGERRLVRAGDLVAWDPSGAHAGTGVAGRPWSAQLMLVDAAQVAALCGEVAFARPVIDDGRLAADFARLHSTLRTSPSRLERDAALATWLRRLVTAHGEAREPADLGPADRQALRRALGHLHAHPEENVSLAALAEVAGIGPFRLVRLFRERLGLPPHAFQVAARVERARRLLEAGEPIAAVAAQTGFADQSHLHRHFRRSVGFTPGQYQRSFAVA